MKFVKLSEICSFSRGLTYSKSDEVEFSSNIVLRANNIDLASNSLNLEDLRYIKESVQIKREKIVKKNSLIICTASGSKSHVGKVALIDEDYGFAFGGFMGQLTPLDNCHPKFLYYILTSSSFKDFLMTLNDGTNINNLKFSDIEDYKVPLPSLERQSEIVEILESAFAEIDLLERNLRLGDQNTKQLLQSTLSKSLVNSSFKSGEADDCSGQDNVNVEKYKSECIDRLCNVEYGTRVVRKKDAGTRYPVYGGGGETFFLDTFNRENRVVVARFAMSEKCTRRVTGKFALNDSGLTLSPQNPEELSQDYLDYFVLGMNDEIYNSARGTAQKNLDVPAFRQMIISYPISLERQVEIVTNLDSVFAEIETLKNKIEAELIFASKLRQSIQSKLLTEIDEVA